MKAIALIPLLVLLLTGCSTIDSRIKEHADTFNTLNETDQQIIRYGYISVGFTRDMVYMALDKPEKIIPGPGPDKETWVYRNFYAGDGSDMSIGVRAQAVGSNRGSAMRGGGASGGGTRYETAYDPSAENVKELSKSKVHVIFIGDKVADIQITQAS